MMREDDFSRLELDLRGCVSNYRYFRSLLEPSTKLLVLVKANAYGHGAVEFAAMMQRAGADYLAVAYPVEGLELRQNGISLPIIVLTAGTDFYPEIVQTRMEPSIPNLESLDAFCTYLIGKGLRDYPIHIKLDTGMHRLGFMTSEIPALVEYLNAHPEVKVKSIFSHLCVAEDPEEDAFTKAQFDLFERNSQSIMDGIGYRPMRHILNSAGIERFPEHQYDMVRLGIGIYGISALPGVQLAPVASLKCKVLQVKHLRSGDTIGYGRWGKAAAGTVIATIPVGYADGIDRHLGRGKASFSVNGHRAPTIGNICMDMCMLDVTGIDVKVGDTVTVFGADPTVTELADILGTIPYEILASIPRRIERIVVR
ncbi:MAG: alanine racemase [Bacteroidales bacterium]|nr:alanine racemase [Bacteroidales bacterium]